MLLVNFFGVTVANYQDSIHTLCTAKHYSIINPVLLHKFKGHYKKTANRMKVWDAKPEEAKVRKFDQVCRLQLFLYHIWKRCESGRDLDNFYTISMSDSKEM